MQLCNQSLMCVCFMPHTVKSKQQTTWIQCLISAVERQRETNGEGRHVADCVSVWPPSGHASRWEAAGGWSKGSLALFHSSIVSSPCLPCSPWGLRHLVLLNPNSLYSSLGNVTGWKDVYVLQDFGRGLDGVHREEKKDRAKGKRVLGRNLTAAPGCFGILTALKER